MLKLGKHGGFNRKVNRTGLVPQLIRSVSINYCDYVKTLLSQKQRTTSSESADHTLAILWCSSPVTEFERFLYESNEQVYYELLKILFSAVGVPKWGELSKWNI